MSLELTVISNKGMEPVGGLAFQVGAGGGVIGRSPECDFVLPDPEKFVSRKHGTFSVVNGQFIFTDTSTAGTYVGNQDLLLLHDKIALQDGDRLRIGNYELLVRISASESDFAQPFPEPSKAWTGTESTLEAPAFSEPPAPDLFGDPFGLTPTAPIETPRLFEQQDADAGLASFLGQPDVGPEHENFAPPEPLTEMPGFDALDLLNDIEVPVTVPESTDQAWQIPDDFFGADLEALAPASPEPVLEFPEPPAPAPEILPEAKPPAPEPMAGPAPIGEAPTALREPATVAEMPIRIPSPGGAVSPQPVETPPLQPVETAAPQPLERAAARPAEKSSPAPAGAPDLFRLFLEGAGIGDLPSPREEQLPALMRTLGLLFHDLVDGMMTALRARAEEKRELRVDMTVIRAVNNNPLKATPRAEDAMRIMLQGSHPGFLGPIEAAREGFRDLMSHQLAATAGMQASLAEQLKRFEPAKFEKPFEEGIVFQKKAKCWEAYSRAYPELVRESLENIFGDEFRAVYEQQLHLLKSTPGHGES